MVATIARLKLLLLKNSLKRSTGQLIGLIIGMLYGLGVSVLLVAALVAARWLSIEQRELILVLGGSLLVLLWWLIPMLTSTLDQTVDISRFTSLPIPRRKLLLGTAISGLIGTPGLLTVIVLLATWFTWSTGVLSFVYAIIGSILVLMMTQFGARFLTTAASGLWSSRRGREMMSMFIIIALIVLWPVVTIVMETIRELGDPQAVIVKLAEVAAVAGWLPFGAPWSAAVDAASGNWLIGLAKLAIAAAFVLVLVIAWSKVLDRVLTNPPHEKVSTRAQAGSFDRLAQGTVSAIAVKTLRYWRRDNRLAVSNISLLLLPFLAILIVVFGKSFITLDSVLLASLGLIVAALYGWGSHNMLAYDGSAFWMHLSTGVLGWRDRLGRLIAEGSTGLAFTILSVGVGVALSGRPDLLPIQLGTALTVLCIALSVSMVLSTVWIYAVPAPGDSPFNTPSGAGGLMMLAQVVSLLLTGVLSIPSLAIFVWAVFVPGAPAWLGPLSLVMAVVLGGLCLFLGVRFGGKIMDRRGPEILLQIQKFS